MKSILHDKKVKVSQRLLQNVEVRIGNNRIGADDPKSTNLFSESGFDDVGVS